MPASFKQIVKPDHREVNELCQFYLYYQTIPKTDITQIQMLCKKAKYRYWRYVLTGDAAQCKICSTYLSRMDKMKSHVMSYHKDRQAFTKQPKEYMPEDCYCPLGCDFMSLNKSDFRKHLIAEHKEEDLRTWGISLHYLMLQDGMMDLDSFLAYTQKKLVMQSEMRERERVQGRDRGEANVDFNPHSIVN